MTWWEALILGLVQGLAEFLPISSSGHLVLGEHLLGIDEQSITFEVFVHFGTVLSIVTVYWKRILDILGSFFKALASPSRLIAAFSPGTIEHVTPEPFAQEVGADPVAPDASNGSVRLALFILLTMIPTAIVYVVFGDWLEAQFNDPRFACAMLLVTGTLLLLIRFRPDPSGVLTPGKSLVIGLAQGAAMIPGISRSGSTIASAIYMNVDRKEAADFSFLMSLPVIVGATLLKVLELFEVGAAINWVPLLVGTAVAYVSGVWAIRVVLDFVKRGKLQYFAYYVFVVGILGLLFIDG